VRPGDRGWSAGEAIAPTDAPQIAPHPVDVEAQLALARTRRADVLAAHAQTAAEIAALAVTDDQRRTALDLVVAGGTTGFSGALASDYATAGVNGTGLTPPYRTDPAYDGGLGTSLKNTLGRDLDVFVGLRLDIPLGRHEGEVRHAIQQRSVSRARLAERAILARIESEVRTSVASLAYSVQLVQAADHTVELSQKLLDGTRKRFRAGASTSFDVLRVSEALTQARIEAARARASYQGTLTRLATATGTLLEGAGRARSGGQGENRYLQTRRAAGRGSGIELAHGQRGQRRDSLVRRSHGYQVYPTSRRSTGEVFAGGANRPRGR